MIIKTYDYYDFMASGTQPMTNEPVRVPRGRAQDYIRVLFAT